MLAVERRRELHRHRETLAQYNARLARCRVPMRDEDVPQDVVLILRSKERIIVPIEEMKERAHDQCRMMDAYIQVHGLVQAMRTLPEHFRDVHYRRMPDQGE